MLSWVLFENPELDGLVEANTRLKIITKALFKIVYCRISRGMLNKDKEVLCILLAKTFTKCGYRYGNVFKNFFFTKHLYFFN